VILAFGRDVLLLGRRRWGGLSFDREFGWREVDEGRVRDGRGVSLTRNEDGCGS